VGWFGLVDSDDGWRGRRKGRRVIKVLAACKEEEEGKERKEGGAERTHREERKGDEQLGSHHSE